VLDALDSFARDFLHLPLHPLGAAPLPLQVADWAATRIGKDVFLHSSVPKGWWEEYRDMAGREHDPNVMMARSSLMAFTLTESMQMQDPIGIERWPSDLALKYGIRDALFCSVGRRWLVTYWSRRAMGNLLKPPVRVLLFAGATFAALRLEQLVERDPRWARKHTRITARELAVLRLLSLGRRTAEIADVLGLGEETVRSHLKKLQSKLGACNRTHAVAEALRWHLIP
jgi:LuxR family quorum sensing-dependent transcriptional regulator